MLGWLLFSLVWGPIAQLRAAEVVDRIIAIVNNDIVTLTELNRKMRPFQAKVREMGYPPEKERDMLANVRTAEAAKDVIDDAVAIQQAGAFALQVSRSDGALVKPYFGSIAGEGVVVNTSVESSGSQAAPCSANSAATATPSRL